MEKRKRNRKQQTEQVNMYQENNTERKRGLNGKAEILNFFRRAALMALILYLLFGVCFGVGAVRDADMMPRVSAGDVMLYDRMTKAYHVGDLLVVEADGHRRVGRIAAQPGDVVEIGTQDAPGLWINGSLMTETDIYEPTMAYDNEIAYPMTLGEGEYFLLADHRDGGTDSRVYGAVSGRQIRGKVLAVLRRSGL